MALAHGNVTKPPTLIFVYENCASISLERMASNPHRSRPHSALPPRRFLLGLSNAGPRSRTTVHDRPQGPASKPFKGRRPKPFTD